MPSDNGSTTTDHLDDDRGLAEATRQACIQAALTAFEDASMNGLCCEGAWESAVGAMQGLDLREILEDGEWSRFALEQFQRGTDDDVDYWDGPIGCDT